jgi:hypothetical protein
MTRAEFLEELRLALQGNVSQVQVNENLRYYENYIIEESRKGKTEEQVIEELGSPRLIARTIIDTSEQTDDTYDEAYDENPKSETEHPRGFHMNQMEDGTWDIRYGRFRINSWYGALIGILFMILILYIVAKIMIFLLPVFVVLCVIWFILILVMGIRR